MITKIQIFFLFLCIIYPIAIIYGQSCPALTITTAGDGSNGFCQGRACQKTTGDTTTVHCSSDGNNNSITSMVLTVIDGGTGACNGVDTCNITIDQTMGYGPPGDVELDFACNATTGTYTLFGMTIADPTIYCDASFICNGTEMSPPANPCDCPFPDYRCTSTTVATTTVAITTVATTTVATTIVATTTVATTTVDTPSEMLPTWLYWSIFIFVLLLAILILICLYRRNFNGNRRTPKTDYNDHSRNPLCQQT